MENSLYKQATKENWLFESGNGALNVNDLWNLPLTSKNNRPNLDDVARRLYNAIKETEDISFVNNSGLSASNTLLQQRLELVKDVIATRQAENEARNSERERQARNARIREILAEKQEDSLKNMSVEELQSLLEQ